MKIRLSLILPLFVLSMNAYAQEPFYKGTKSLKASRIDKAPEMTVYPGKRFGKIYPLLKTSLYNIPVRVVYFLDHNSVKNIFKG